MSEDRAYLTYILETIKNIEDITAQERDSLDNHLHAAILYYLHTLAEAAGRLSDALKDEYRDVDWTAIAGLPQSTCTRLFIGQYGHCVARR